jgi:hypothetical protein
MKKCRKIQEALVRLILFKKLAVSLTERNEDEEEALGRRSDFSSEMIYFQSYLKILYQVKMLRRVISDLKTVKNIGS